MRLALAFTSGETLESQPQCQPRVIPLLKCCAEALVFLSSAEGLAFHVNIVNKRNPVHQWEGAKRQNCSFKNRFPGQNNVIGFL